MRWLLDKYLPLRATLPAPPAAAARGWGSHGRRGQQARGRQRRHAIRELRVQVREQAGAVELALRERQAEELLVEARVGGLLGEAVEAGKISPDSVRCIEGDLRDVNVENPVSDWEGTTCVTAYLLPEGLAIIEEPLREWLMADDGLKRLRRRVVCNTWGFKGWVPVRKVVLEEMNGTPLLLYDKSSVLK